MPYRVELEENEMISNNVSCWMRAILFVWVLAVAPSITNAQPHTGGQIVVGQARFTVLTPQCIRLEYSSSARFVDDPSFFAVNRNVRSKDAKIVSDASSTTIDTGVIKLSYKSDGQPFDADNLHAIIGNADWHPGLTNAENLGGTERTLDGWDGARMLSDGVLSRDGWYLLDDSKSVLFSNDWVKSRPTDAGTDWYLLGYGNDYKAALKSLMTISGPVPPRIM